MIVLYPGARLGETSRPVIAFTLGYDPAGSVLTPVTVISSEDSFVVKMARQRTVVADEPSHVVASKIVDRTVSETPVSSVVAGEDDELVISKLPPEHVKSEEPGEH